MAKRKVSFNYLFLKHEGLELSIENALSTIVTFLLSKEKIDRKQDVNSDKFAFLDNVDYDTTSEYHTMQLLFYIVCMFYPSLYVLGLILLF